MSDIELQRGVLGALCELGENVTPGAIAERIRRERSEVIEALYELEQRGLAMPSAWQQGPLPMPRLPIV